MKRNDGSEPTAGAFWSNWRGVNLKANTLTYVHCNSSICKSLHRTEPQSKCDALFRFFAASLPFGGRTLARPGHVPEGLFKPLHAAIEFKVALQTLFIQLNHTLWVEKTQPSQAFLYYYYSNKKAHHCAA